MFFLNPGTAVHQCCSIGRPSLQVIATATALLYLRELHSIEFPGGKSFYCTLYHCTLRALQLTVILHSCNCNTMHAAQKPPVHCAGCRLQAQGSWHRNHISTLRNTTHQDIFKHHKINFVGIEVRFCYPSHTTIESTWECQAMQEIFQRDAWC